MLNTKVAGKFELKNKFGAGAFGEIYLTTTSKGEEWAVKVERLSSRSPQLIYESKVLKQIQGASGIPKLKWAGIEGNYTMMVLELLGKNIEELYNMCNRNFSLKTILMIVEQMLTRIEYLHSKSFIHRDIKPENFLVGLGGKSNVIYIIDFGLSKKYRDPKTLKHIDYKEGRHLTGTARYVSINTHAGIEQSRRDDLEAIGYLLVYLLKNGLPWQGMNAPNRLEKYKLVMDKKISTSCEDLCRGLPDEFKSFLEYCRCLKFEESPNYERIRKSFRDLMRVNQLELDYFYDWVAGHRKGKSQALTENPQTVKRTKKRNLSDMVVYEKKPKKHCSVF